MRDSENVDAAATSSPPHRDRDADRDRDREPDRDRDREPDREPDRDRGPDLDRDPDWSRAREWADIRPRLGGARRYLSFGGGNVLIHAFTAATPVMSGCSVARGGIWSCAATPSNMPRRAMRYDIELAWMLPPKMR